MKLEENISTCLVIIIKKHIYNKGKMKKKINFKLETLHK